MWLRTLGIVLEGVVQVLELLVPDPPQGTQQVGELLADLVALGLPLADHLQQGADLRVVVAADLRLDRLGARHGGLAAHDGCRPAQPRGHDGPERVQGAGADAVLVDEAVEGLEVLCLLVVHMGHQGAEMGVLAEDRGALGRVDEDGCEFAGLVDSEL